MNPFKSILQIINDVYDSANHVLKTNATITNATITDAVIGIDQTTSHANEVVIKDALAGIKDNGAAWSAVHTVTNSADLSSVANVSGAPTSGQKIVVTDIVISASAEMTVTLKEETSGTVVGGPYYLAANQTLQLTMRSRQIKLATANKHLQAIASTSGPITIETWTYSEA